MCKVFAYVRVSTDKQDLENQRHEIQSYANQKGLVIDDWLEVEVSARKNTTARKIDDLISMLKKKDILIVSELSRLGRSIRENLNIIHEMHQKKVSVHLVKQGIQTNGDSGVMGTMMISNLSFAAELERELISQRTKAALARKKEQGMRLGNPRLHLINQEKTRKAEIFAESLRPFLQECVAKGLSQRQIMNELNQRAISTSTGKEWKLIQLQRTLNRLGLKTQKK
jgi:DNA invertase Pin-like site-specific DNA recombinase